MLKVPREREYQESIVFVGARYKHLRIDLSGDDDFCPRFVSSVIPRITTYRFFDLDRLSNTIASTPPVTGWYCLSSYHSSEAANQGGCESGGSIRFDSREG